MQERAIEKFLPIVGWRGKSNMGAHGGNAIGLGCLTEVCSPFDGRSSDRDQLREDDRQHDLRRAAVVAERNPPVKLGHEH